MVRFQKLLRALLKQGISTNVGSYVGSSQIWTYVRGQQAGPPTPAELDRHAGATSRKAMQDGALGVASSLSGPPGSWIDTDTLIAMCKVASEYGGIYSTHMRTEGQGVFESVAEAIEIGRKANVPVDIIHLKIAEHKMWGQHAGADRNHHSRLAQTASRWKRMCIRIAPARTIWQPSCRRGFMKAVALR